MEKYYSTNEVALMCQVSRGSVIRWIREGKLEAATTAGGHHRIWIRDLIKFLKSLNMILPSELTNLPDQKRPVILIVDDDISVVRLLRSFLLQNFPDFKIHEAHDGFDAGMSLIQLHPDLIFLDLGLPKIDGFRICETIRKQPELQKSTIIAISGLDDEYTRERILSFGADDFLAKPFEMDQLREKVSKWVEVPSHRHPSKGDF